MSNFEDIISFESLYRAHRRARLSKRHKKEVILFEAELSKNLWALHYDLKYGRYEVGGYHSFMIYDPKEREIQAIGYRDRIIQHSICDNYLTPLLDRHLIYDNAACRKNKGTGFAISRWRRFMAEYYKKNGAEGYFVKLDVRKYFPSINHSILKEKLSRIVGDGKILDLLFKIIDSYNKEEDVGLPMGNQTSQCFALLYLDNVDRYLKEKMRVKYYVRYMDDMLFLVRDKAKAQRCIEHVKALLKENKLVLNPKSQITEVKNGVDFLGWRFLYADNGKIVQKVRPSTKKRIIERAKLTVFQVRTHRKNEIKLSEAKASYEGYLMSGNAYHFFQKVNLNLMADEVKAPSL